MQVVILAAGMGKRLGKYTKDRTKCLVEVNGKPILDRALEAVLQAGVTKISIVIGFQGEHLRQYVRRTFPDLDVTFIENPDFDKTNNIYSLWLARHILATDDTILLEGDIVFEPEIIAELINDARPDLAVVSKYEPWMDGTVTILNEDHSIHTIVDKKKFSWAETLHYHKTVNIYKFSRDFINRHYLPFLDAYIRSFGQNEYYEQVLKVLVFLEHTGLKAFSIDANRWYEIDDPHDLNIAEIRFAEPEEKLTRLQACYGGYWRFPEIVDYCYLVNPFFPPPRLVDELRNCFFNLLSQYPSGMDVQTSLAAKLFSVAPEQVLVGNGAAELIAALLAETPGTIGVPVPTFNEYISRVCPDRLVEFPCNKDFAYTVDELLANAVGKVNTLVLVNPDNPSGHFLGKEDMLRLLEGCESNGINLVLDESFADFAEESLRYTFLSEDFLAAHPSLTVIKSISKSFGVPGLRLGILASGNTQRIARLRATLPIWNINSFGEYFMQIFDKYRSDYDLACNLLAAERKRFAARLSEIDGLVVYPSQANYLLCRWKKTPNTENSFPAAVLRHEGILLKDLTGKRGFPDMSANPGESMFRVAVRSPEENDHLIHVFWSLASGQAKTISFSLQKKLRLRTA